MIEWFLAATAVGIIIILGGLLIRSQMRAVRAEAENNRLPEVERQLILLREQENTLRERNAELTQTLKQERAAAEEKIILLEKAEKSFQNAFQALSADALSKNNQSFLELAQATLSKFQTQASGDLKSREQAIADLIKPIKSTLTGMDTKLQDLEKTRVSAYEVLRHQVQDLLQSQKDLRGETANLVKALRTPNVRGRWGEMQLRRVVEITGLTEHVDFIEQVNMKSGENRLRPDMLVKLPGDKTIIIDAKTPLSAYLDALEAPNEAARKGFLQDHARQVRKHIEELSNRSYWNHLPLKNTPEFVVMFLPGEPFFSAALEQDPTLIELGVEKHVILTTPSTLIGMLHAVSYGWQQESLADNAREITQLGRDLYKSVADMGKHMAKLGRALKGSVQAYNGLIGNVERSVLPKARRFKDLQASAVRSEIEESPSIEYLPRDIQAEEIQESA